MLEQFKADLIRKAYTLATTENIEPGVALLDKEIERLREETQAEWGRGRQS